MKFVKHETEVIMKKLTIFFVIGMMLAFTACKKDVSDAESQPTETVASDETETAERKQEEAQPEETAGEPAKAGKIDEDMILRYLSGELSAKIDADFYHDLGFCCMYEEETDGQAQYLPFHNGMELIPFETLYDMVKDTSDGVTEYPIVSYATATTKSGTDAMIIRFDGIGTEGGEPVIYSCFVFTLDTERNEGDTPFNLVYAFDSWSKHHVEFDEGLIFSGFGSNGAGDSTEWMGTINEDGKYKLIYSLEMLDEDWVAMYGEDHLNVKYNSNSYEWSRGSHFDIIETADGSYYSYTADEKVDKDNLDEFIKALKDNELSETEDVNKLKEAALANVGIDISALSEFTDFTIYGDEGLDDFDIPSSFVEEAASKTSFDSYDELIGFLKQGEAYAYVNMLGSNEQILLITDEIAEKDGKATASLVYPYLRNGDGKIVFGSLIGGSGEGNSVAVTSDGLVYSCSEDSIEVYCISKENKSIMCKDYLYKGTDENGKTSYTGFIRKENSLNDDGTEYIDTDSDEIYNNLVSEYENAKPIEFTLVK